MLNTTTNTYKVTGLARSRSGWSPAWETIRAWSLRDVRHEAHRRGIHRKVEITLIAGEAR